MEFALPALWHRMYIFPAQHLTKVRLFCNDTLCPCMHCPLKQSTSVCARFEDIWSNPTRSRPQFPQSVINERTRNNPSLWHPPLTHNQPQHASKMTWASVVKLSVKVLTLICLCGKTQPTFMLKRMWSTSGKLATNIPSPQERRIGKLREEEDRQIALFMPQSDLIWPLISENEIYSRGLFISPAAVSLPQK